MLFNLYKVFNDIIYDLRFCPNIYKIINRAYFYNKQLYQMTIYNKKISSKKYGQSIAIY